MEQILSDTLSEFSTVNRRNLDELVNLVEELVINKVKIEKIKNELSNNAQAKILDQELRIISDIQESIKKVRLIKIETIHNTLTDLINEQSKILHIPVDFIFEGQDTQIENSLVNFIHNYFTYLTKNIFENEFIALENSKYQIKISIHSDNKNLTAVIESNGKGFDEQLICKTLEKNCLDLSLFDESALKDFLILTESAFNIEAISKMKQSVEDIGGTIVFEAALNKYRRITFTIPLTSSIMQGLLVTIGGQVYAIPLEFIETILDKNAVAIKTSKNAQMILYMDHVLRLIHAAELLEVQTNEDASCILIVNANNKRVALLVDTLLDQTDMVIKKSPPMIKDIHEIKGTTILGDGLVTLVLDIPSILKEI